jgi:hypothetical protein
MTSLQHYSVRVPLSFFAGTNPAKPRNSLSPPLKTALRYSRTAPRVTFRKNERPVVNVAKEIKDSPKAPTPVTSVASAQPSSKTRYPPKTDMDTINCFKCDKMGHFACDCRNPSTKPPNDQRNESPGPTRKPVVPNAHIVVKSNQGAAAFEWDHEETGSGCVTVHTARVSVGFNSNNLTDTITELPISTHARAPSLLGDGDIESHPGPPLPKVNALLQFHNARERERDFQESRYQFSQPTYTEGDDIYSEPAESEQADSEYSSQSYNAPPFTDEMVIEILDHVGTAQSTLLAQEQKHRISHQEPTLYVRQMSSQ